MAYVEPRKFILTKDQLEHFQNSKTHEEILGYIQALNDAVVGVKLTDPCTTSPVRKSFKGKHKPPFLKGHSIHVMYTV